MCEFMHRHNYEIKKIQDPLHPKHPDSMTTLQVRAYPFVHCVSDRCCLFQPWTEITMTLKLVCGASGFCGSSSRQRRRRRMWVRPVLAQGCLIPISVTCRLRPVTSWLCGVLIGRQLRIADWWSPARQAHVRRPRFLYSINRRKSELVQCFDST